MTNDRFEALMTDDSLDLTPAEIIEGWHFCAEFDGLLVAPSCEEFDCCTCSLPYMQIDTVAMQEKIVWQERIARASLSNAELREIASRSNPPRDFVDEDEDGPW